MDTLFIFIICLHLGFLFFGIILYIKKKVLNYHHPLILYLLNIFYLFLSIVSYFEKERLFQFPPHPISLFDIVWVSFLVTFGGAIFSIDCKSSFTYVSKNKENKQSIFYLIFFLSSSSYALYWLIILIRMLRIGEAFGFIIAVSFVVIHYIVVVAFTRREKVTKC